MARPEARPLRPPSDEERGAVHRIRRRLASRSTARWVLVAALTVLLAFLAFAIAVSSQRAAWTVVEWLAAIAFVAPIAAALGALLWYGRILGGAVEETALAEAATRAMEEGFRTVASTMGDGIITMDDRSRIQYVNGAVERIFGYSREELLGNELTMLMPERFRQKHRAGIQRYLSIGRRSVPWEGLQFQGLRKDGREIPLEISLGDHVIGDKRVFTGILRDITERKGAELALQRSEARFRQLFEGSEEAIFSKELDGTITSWNASAERIYGYTSEEAIGQNVSVLAPTDKLQELKLILDQLRRGEKVDHLETARVRKDGRRIVVSLNISPIRDDSGAIVGASTMARDVTERKRAEQALRESEAKFRGLWESAPDGIFVIDSEATILDVNRAGERLMDRDRSAVVGHRLTEFIPPPSRPTLLRFIEEQVAGAITGNLHEGTWLSPVGEPIHVQFTSQVVPNPGGPSHLVVVVRDVSEQRDMQRKLVESERWASMGKLASFVAHEINTPLTNISLLTASVARRVGDPEAQERLKKISMQGKIAASITQELLRFARPGVINPVETDLKELVQEAVEQTDAFRKRTTEIRTELGTKAVVCAVDPLRIHEVLVNLLKNAYEATPTGQVKIRIEERGPAVAVTVADTGSGMSPEVRSRVFEPFYTTKKKGEGTGLGLAIARSFVVNHGGDLTVTSEVGKGSTFTVVLPRQQPGPRPRPKAPEDPSNQEFVRFS
jgi:two-component system cell cycle sensor histidine kinase/response regulator CckA